MEWQGVKNWDDSIIPYLEKISQAIHKHGAICISQITHRGRRGSSTGTGYPLWGPSDIREEPHREYPHVMTKEEIRIVVQAYAAAAVRLKKGGFDGVDLPFYGGQLPEQFMSPLSNRRTDEYGGNLDNRLRLSLEIVAAVREAVGPDFIINVRLSGDHQIEGGLTHEDMKRITERLDALNMIDSFLITSGVPETNRLQAVVTPSLYHPQGLNNFLAASIKEVVSVPVIVAGRVVTPQQAEEILANGWADMVGMVRALIADPELPKKAQEGRLDGIRICVGASEGCIGRIRFGLPVACIQNPVAGKEDELGVIEPAPVKKKVLVVGGGPAGLETARVAAIRGHKVILYEKNDRLGGQVIPLSQAPGRGEYIGIIDWLAVQVEKLGVDVRLNTTATAELILAENPDAVVVTTGAVPRRPNIPGATRANVTTVPDILLGQFEAGERCLMVDEEGYFFAPSAADYLATRGKKVEIITRYYSVGQDIDENLKADIHDRLCKKGVKLTPLTVATAIENGGVRVRHVYSEEERIIEVDTVVLAFGAKADDSLYHQLAGQVAELYMGGDCVAPRRIYDAIYDGTRTARKI
jgi:2,4-dienoyl-CoA reductase-like NADH-dependent reductase (Old Yellow Enzyme family)/thioredoxin reductase